MACRGSVPICTTSSRRRSSGRPGSTLGRLGRSTPAACPPPPKWQNACPQAYELSTEDAEGLDGRPGTCRPATRRGSDLRLAEDPGHRGSADRALALGHPAVVALVHLA